MQMTNKRLKNLYYLNRDIDRLTRKIAELESIAEGTTTRITGLPAGCIVNDKVGTCAARLIVLREQLEEKQKSASIEYEEITYYIENLDDPLMRQIMQYRHVNCLPWEEVANLIGGGNNAGSVRTAHWRFLHPDKL